MVGAIVPGAGNVPVGAGVGAADPYRSQRSLVEQALALGYAGITNTPTAGVYSGDFRAGIETAGLGYGREIELFALCNALDIFTVAYAFDEDQARSVADAGADVIIAHLGLTASSADTIARQNALDRACEVTERMVNAVRTTRDDAIVGVHGGPLESSDAVGYVLSRTHAHASGGGSPVGRIPVGHAV